MNEVATALTAIDRLIQAARKVDCKWGHYTMPNGEIACMECAPLGGNHAAGCYIGNLRAALAELDN